MSNVTEQERFRQEPEDPLDRWRREQLELRGLFEQFFSEVR
jgi:hypothetical protein